MRELLNLGCGFDIKDGWVNVDRIHNQGIQTWDAANDPIPKGWQKHFDFILINHVLCTLRPIDAGTVLVKSREMLKNSGVIHVIDMDITMAIAMYQQDHDEFPIKDGSIDHNFLMHVSGYGTRLSLYTPRYMTELLLKAGFRNIHPIPASDDPYDTRPVESLRFEAIR